MILQQLGEFSPIIEIVNAIIIVNHTRMVQVQQGQCSLPGRHVDGVKVTIENEDIGRHLDLLSGGVIPLFAQSLTLYPGRILGDSNTSVNIANLSGCYHTVHKFNFRDPSS